MDNKQPESESDNSRMLNVILNQETPVVMDIDYEEEESRPPSDYEKLIKASDEFHRNICEFSTSNNRWENIAKDDTVKQNRIVEQAKGARIIMHSSVNRLIKNFLTHKLKLGSKIEKQVYNGMTKEQFVLRLISKRPLYFYTSYDFSQLRNGETPSGSAWPKVGSDEEEDILLEDYLSYDEMQISALIGVSTPVFFINKGSRNNAGMLAESDTYEKEGIYVAIVGARFEHKNKMESRYCLVTKNNHKSEYGYGKEEPDEVNPERELLKIWAKFFGLDYLPTYTEVTQSPHSERHVSINSTNETYIDEEIYKKRMKLVIEPFLCEANKRGEEAKKKVYIHTIGLGLGVWQISRRQPLWQTQVYHDIVSSDLPLKHISDINFSWFPEDITCEKFKNGDEIETKHNKVKIHFSKRDPAEKLTGDDADKLLVASYAWDSNSFPGNEYWKRMLTASGDPAAACCSTVPETQNPYINTRLQETDCIHVYPE